MFQLEEQFLQTAPEKGKFDTYFLSINMCLLAAVSRLIKQSPQEQEGIQYQVKHQLYGEE